MNFTSLSEDNWNSSISTRSIHIKANATLRKLIKTNITVGAIINENRFESITQPMMHQVEKSLWPFQEEILTFPKHHP